MGQHLASFREFFRMDGEKPDTDVYTDGPEQSPFNMLAREENENVADIENNGNEPSLNANTVTNNDRKGNRNLENDQLNLALDNRNSRFESIYSQPIDAQETKQVCNNGNFVGPADVEFKSEEPCCSSSGSSNSSSSSEDSPINPPLRRTSKTLSFGKQKIKQRSKDQSPVCNHVLSSKKKRSNWVLKFNCAKSKGSKNTDIPEQPNNSSECVCTGYRRTEEHPMGAGVVFNNRSAPQSPILGPLPPSPVIDLSRFNPAEFPMEVRI